MCVCVCVCVCHRVCIIVVCMGVTECMCNDCVLSLSGYV